MEEEKVRSEIMIKKKISSAYNNNEESEIEE
jgi:hypothetical protein